MCVEWNVCPKCDLFQNGFKNHPFRVLWLTASLCSMMLMGISPQTPGHSTKQASAVAINRKEVRDEV